MAYETGTATSIADLISKLTTFATGLSTTPWTSDELAATQATLHRGDCHASFAWAASSAVMMTVFQSLGWVTSVFPDQYTDDSGNGSSIVPATLERRCNFIYTGPYTYYFFAGEGSTPYIHCVVEIEPNRFRFFGFGNIIKNNDFTGGEYVYGGLWDQNASYIDVPSSDHHAVLLDNANPATNGATVHLEGLPNQDASSKWGVCMTDALASAGNDTAGNPRVMLFGTARSGLWTRMLSWMPISLYNSYKPIAPIQLLYRDDSYTPESLSFLGTMPDVGVVNIKNISSGGTFSDGTDDWMIFPWSIKQYLPAAGSTEQSWNAGFAFKKIT